MIASNSNRLPHRSSAGRVRFSLLTVLIFFTVVSVLLGLWYRSQTNVAEAILQISFQPGQTDRQHAIFCATQAELIKSHFLLNAALSRSNIGQLPYVARHEDPLQWLDQQLKVSFPGSSEIMTVSLKGPDAAMSDYCQLIDAIIDSYSNEFFYKQRVRDQEFRDAKVKQSELLRRELRAKTVQLYELTAKSDPEAEVEDSSIAMLRAEIENLTEFWKEMELELRRHDIEVKTRQGSVRVLQNAAKRSR